MQRLHIIEATVDIHIILRTDSFADIDMDEYKYDELGMAFG